MINNVQEKKSVIWSAQGLNPSVVISVNSGHGVFYDLDYEFFFSVPLYMCGCVETIFLHCSLYLLLLESQVFYYNGVNFMAGCYSWSNNRGCLKCRRGLRAYDGYRFSGPGQNTQTSFCLNIRLASSSSFHLELALKKSSSCDVRYFSSNSLCFLSPRLSHLSSTRI